MKTKKVTFSMVNSKIKDEAPVTITVCEGIEANVKKRLTAKEALEFVDDIVSLCVDTDEGTYTPEIYDGAVRIMTLRTYAGFGGPKTFEEAYKVAYGTDVYRKVLDVIDQEQYNWLLDGAQKKITFMANAIVATAASKVMDLIKKMDEVMENGEQAMAQMNSPEFMNTMNGLVKQLAGRGADEAEPVAADAEPMEENVLKMSRRKEPGD